MLDQERLSNEMATKDSNFAIITYLKSMGIEEVNSKGEIMQFNRGSYEGQTDLISASEFLRLCEDFPGKVKGSIIKYGNLENMLSYCFEHLKDDYSRLNERDAYCDSKIDMLNSFAFEGKLIADHQTPSSLDDLANKVFNVQETIRNLQSRELSNSNHMKK